MTDKEKAKKGVDLLKEAVLSLVKEKKQITNAEIATLLGIESDFEGGQRNYISYSILGALVREKRIYHEKRGARRYFYPIEN